MRILVSTEGTILMHKGGTGLPRDAVVRQVLENEGSVNDFASYVPIGNAALKCKDWTSRGADVLYLTSRTESEEVKDIQAVLDAYHFPAGELLF